MPLVLNYARREDDELKEHVLQACEAMVSKCGSEISCHIPGIVALCLEYITYDPNYNYDDDEDSDMECDDEGEEDASDDEYSDDDDVSWKVRMIMLIIMMMIMMMKVRRAAAKCLEAVVTTRHEMMDQFYTTISPALINRWEF